MHRSRALVRWWLLVWLVLLGPAESGQAQTQDGPARTQPAQTQPAQTRPARTPRPPVLDSAPPAVIVRTIAVPDVARQSISQASRTLRAAGFDSRLAAGQSADANSFVERTIPPAGTTHRLGRTPPVVELVLNAKPPARRVPSIIGKTCAEARVILERQKLRLSSCDAGAITGNVAGGAIHTQQPAADTPIDDNTRVVDARFEPDSVIVPPVTSLSAPQALTQIQQARLRAQPSLTPVQPWHRVAAQRPEAGRRVVPGSVVALDLVYTVPAVRGLECDEARRRVLAAGHRGLDCRVETVSTPSGEAGRVFRQVPAAESVSRTPLVVQAFTPLERVRVPVLVGIAEDVAQRTLRQARLVARVEGPTADTGRQVAAQSPAPGTQVAPESIVDLRLALTVPDLRGATCDAARTLAQRHGFATFECRRKLAAPSAALGRVFEQSPAARTVLDTAQPIDATVAQGITVPKVTGLDPRAAITRLQAAGLEGRADASDGDRIVVRQQPQAEVEVAPATRVSLVTQRMTQVPDVVGRTLDEALPLISRRDLRTRSDADGTPAMRRVRAQQPAANTRVAVGQTVELTTVLEVVVPDAVDAALDDARARVERAGLRAQVEAGPRPGAKVVRRQQPAAGTRVEAASAVTLHAVTRVKVPELLQKSCDDARTAARSEGLNAEPCDVDGPLGVKLGTPIVWQQSLVPGSTVDEGELLRLQARTAVAPVAALGAGLGALLAGGVLLFVKRPWRSRPKPPPPPAPTLHLELRIEPDLSPSVAILAPRDSNGDAPTEAHDDVDRDRAFERALRIRIEAAEPNVSIRAWDPSDLDAT